MYRSGNDFELIPTVTSAQQWLPEMGDRFATIDMGRRPRFTDASVQQTHDDKLYVLNYGAKAATTAQQALTCAGKLGAAIPLSVGEVGPHVTQCRRSRGPTPYQVLS